MSADIHHLEAGVPGFQVDGLTESIPANALFADGAACAIVHGSHALVARSAYRRGFALGLAGLCPGVWTRSDDRDGLAPRAPVLRPTSTTYLPRLRMREWRTNRTS